jgi:hypothetical protein
MLSAVEAISPAHLAWWVAAAITVILGIFALIEAWDAVRSWIARRRSGQEHETGTFRVNEDQAVRKHHYRRQEPGYHSLRSRGLGDPPIRTADQWSPTDEGGTRAESEDRES